MRRLLSILVVLFFLCGNSQDIKDLRNLNSSSSEEIFEYINKIKTQGITLIEAETAIKLQGATQDEINKLKEFWNLNELQNTTVSANLTSPNSDFGKNQILDEKEGTKSKRFGSDFFKNTNITESPQLFLATPKDYRLGPGDELIINLYGASENSYSVEISREGNVKFDRLAPIYLSGLSINQAVKRLKMRLSKIYTGLNSENLINKVEIDVSLKKARSIVVNIIGNIQAPGTYTISGFSSILNALYAAGGPNDIGTYRNVTILRSGEKIKEIDLYEYFVKGSYPDFYLRDQDVIFIPPVNKLINISSGFRTIGLFELKNDETFKDLISFSGGFKTEAFKDKIFINRIDGLKKNFIEISKNTFDSKIPYDGDVLEAKIPNDYIENQVNISGSILLTGAYSLENVKNIGQLIESSGGFTREALKSKAILYRNNDGLQDEIISIDLNNKADLETELNPLDSLFVPTKQSLDIDKFVLIKGYVKNDSLIRYRKNLTVSDVIIEAGGFKEYANKDEIKIYRNVSGEGKNSITELLIESIDDEYVSKNNIFLKPNDFISVEKQKNIIQPGSYQILGEAASVGYYSIKDQNQKFSSIVRNISFKPSADTNSLYVQRGSLKIPLKYKNGTIINDLTVSDGDVLQIPPINNTIKILGEVQNEIIIPFKNNLNVKNTIKAAGGLKFTADRKKIYVLSQNGEGKKTDNFLGFKSYPKLKPGDIIYVPIKEGKDPLSFSDILGLTSGLTSLVALIRIIQN